MGLLGFLFVAAAAMNVMDNGGHHNTRGFSSADDAEAQFYDGYPDDYVGDGLEGTDDLEIKREVIS